MDKDGQLECTPSRPLQRLRVALLAVLLPFFYGAATRVPLIYIGVEARYKYLLPWWEVGLLIATYQASRAVINSIIPLLGNVFGHVIGVGLGIVGYLLHAIIVNNLAVLWVSVAMVGLSEVIICMQSYVKVEVTPFGARRLREYLRLQYASNVAGTAVGFTVAAALYNTNGIRAAAYFGFGLEVAELVSLFAYLGLTLFCPPSELTEEFILSTPVLGVKLPPEEKEDTYKYREHRAVVSEQGEELEEATQQPGKIPSPFEMASGAAAVEAINKGNSPNPKKAVAMSRGMSSRLSSYNRPNFAHHAVFLPENELGAEETLAFLEGMRIEPSIKKAFVSKNTLVPLESLRSYEIEHQFDENTQEPGRFSTRLMSIVESQRNLKDSVATADGGGNIKNRPPWIVYLIVITFAVQALMIGVILSTAPIMFYDVYDLKFVFVGVILGVGEFLGCFTLFALVPTAHQYKIRKYFRGPLNLLIVVGALGLIALLYAIKALAAAIVATLVIMALNDFGTSLAAEFQGGVVHPDFYTQVNALANTSRRVGNTVTAALGPILFGVAYWCPFVTFGLVTLVWMAIMAFAFHIRANQVISKHYTKKNTTAAKGMSTQSTAEASMESGDLSGDISMKKKRVPRGLRFYMTKKSYITAELMMWKKEQ